MDPVSWSDLPEDIFITIAGHLPTVIDYLNVSRVCKPWRSTALSPLNLSIPSKPPFLMLAAESKEKTSECLRGFVEFNNQGNHHKVFTVSLPEIHDDVRIMGSTGNWVILINLDLDIFMFNPFDKRKLQFPSQSTLPDQLYDEGKDECDCDYDCDCNAALANWYTQENLRDLFIPKAFLSSSNVRDVVMMIIFGGKQTLAIARPGDLSWTPVQKQIASCEYYVYAVQDVIFFQGQFYSVNVRAGIAVIDVNSTPPKAVEIMETFHFTRNVGEGTRCYLVEWLGKLLLVIRYDDRKVKTLYKTSRFKVYMLDFNNKVREEVTSLGEHSVFLGYNTSVSLLVSKYSHLKRNCIYFTDDNYSRYMGLGRQAGHDMGVFDLNDKIINSHYNGVSTSLHSPPLWIISQSTC